MAKAASLLLLASHAFGYDVDGCTSVIVGRGATVDGSAITSHSNDCSDCDWRMVYVPAKDHAPGAQRTIYDGSWGQYPRLVDPERAAAYQSGAGITASTVTGHIPQVSHTHALWESSYSLMNEHGLALGESTCAAFLVGNSTKDGGDALFAIRTLMALALERCTTARCAVQTMGDLGTQYGFYGEDPGQGGAGEAITVIDAQGEAWVFHITGGVPAAHSDSSWPGQRGALWAAQRVPDGHVAVVANTFIIREIDTNDADNFMFHPGVFELAHEAGLWDMREPFNWYRSMQPDPRVFGPPTIPMYATLRTWGVMRHAAPTAQYPLNDDLQTFPFSTPVDGKVSHLDVFDWFREHYEGTEYDMELGVLAGPWQSPNRAEGGMGMREVKGQFARAISIARTSYTVVSQSGIPQPVAWFAPDAPASSVFVPFFASVARNGGGFDEEAYGQGSMKSFSFTSGVMQPAWWAFDFVANYMEISYRNMSRTYVYPAVRDLQAKVANDTHAALAAAAAADNDVAVGAALTLAQTRIQRHVTQTWWSLAELLVVRYNDLAFNFPEHAPTLSSAIGYPAFWLDMIGFNQESWRPTWVQPAAHAPALLPAGERALLLPEKPSEGLVISPVTIGSACMVLSGVLAAGVVLGYRLGRRDRADVVASESPYTKFGSHI